MFNSNIGSNIALSDLGQADARPTSVLPYHQRFAWLTASAIMLAVLIAPALWNGFPLIFADTGGYLARPFDGTLELGRSALYGAFLAGAISFDFWPDVLVQAGLAIWVIVLTLRTHLNAIRPAHALSAVLMLAVLTSLPWTVSQLMPDIFVPLAALALHLMAFRHRELRNFEIVGLGALTAFAVASHMSILSMVLVLVLFYAVMMKPASRLCMPRPQLAFPAAALAAGVALALASNALIAGQLAFTPGGSNFLFARLLQDGIVGRYLDRVCPDPTLRLCAFRDQLPATADDWLWWPGSPLTKLGNWQGFAPEANRIIMATIVSDPSAQLVSALKDTAEQFVAVATGDGVNPDNNQHAEWVLSVLAPHAMARFHAAAQQRARLDFTDVNWIQVPIALIATLALPIVIIMLRRRRPPIAALALTALIALLANAAVCGIFSGPHDRYQSRLLPIAAFVTMIALLDVRRDKASRQPAGGSAATADALLARDAAKATT